jgi:hypothetical protein
MACRPWGHNAFISFHWTGHPPFILTINYPEMIISAD